MIGGRQGGGIPLLTVDGWDGEKFLSISDEL